MLVGDAFLIWIMALLLYPQRTIQAWKQEIEK